ncbi:MAG: host attachment protein [Rickettsiales bacterium]|jgi:protein required for attachment to host cells|nr:host attachment protein [Rickettsiales bacterium]
MTRNQKLTWVLVCDSSKAKLFINRSARDGLHEINEEFHPIPKTSELITDQPGQSPHHTPGDSFLSYHAFNPPTDPRVHEKKAFLRHVAEKINRREKAISRLVIIAPPKALNILREAISPNLKQKIIGEIAKDLTHETETTLPQFLKEHMRIYDPLHDFTTPGRHRIEKR